jgi:amino acid transporter
MSNAYPSAGGIAMFLKKAYGETMVTGAAALLMYFSMVINESLVARTFGTYSLQLFDIGPDTWLVPALGVGLLGFAFLVNILGNRFIESFSFFTAFIKIAGITLFALTVFFDLSRIASLGAIFYLIMDIAIHWGVLRHLRHEIDAKASVLVAAIVLDLAVLAAFVVVKAQTDLLVIWAALLGLTVIVAGERYFVRTRREDARGG